MVRIQEGLPVPRVVDTVVLCQEPKDEDLDFIRAKAAALAGGDNGWRFHIKSNGRGEVMTIQFEKPGKFLPHSTSTEHKSKEEVIITNYTTEINHNH